MTRVTCERAFEPADWQSGLVEINGRVRSVLLVVFHAKTMDLYLQ